MLREYRYTGDGTVFYSSVPTRTLSQEEWDTIAPEVQKAAIESGLYVSAAVAEEEPDVTD